MCYNMTKVLLIKLIDNLTTILLGRFSLSAIAEMSLNAFIKLRSLAFIYKQDNTGTFHKRQNSDVPIHSALFGKILKMLCCIACLCKDGNFTLTCTHHITEHYNTQLSSVGQTQTSINFSSHMYVVSVLVV